jgi:hypothetical protein
MWNSYGMKRSLFSLLLLFALMSSACSSSDSAELQSMAEKIEELEQTLEDAATTTTQSPTTTQPPTTTRNIRREKWVAACKGAEALAVAWSNASVEAVEVAEAGWPSENRDYAFALFDEVGWIAGIHGSLWESLSASPTDSDEIMFIPNLLRIESVASDPEIFENWVRNMETIQTSLVSISDACLGYGLMILNGLTHDPRRITWSVN